MRLVIARCQVDYVGRLTAHLPMAQRLLLIKADGSVSVHSDDRAYKLFYPWSRHLSPISRCRRGGVRTRAVGSTAVLGGC
ncbi:hypothetical protein [Saccharopolyspora spinosa]|uniref:hypothetical protein n=1 Tax=Saccharopolyspora spinosa TaxID=60894 RepID=UPI003B42C0D5